MDTPPARYRCQEVFGITVTGGPEIPDADAAARHNAKHEAQRQKFYNAVGKPLGYIVFRLVYITNHIRFGFEHNPFELEARDAERTIPGVKPGA